MKLEAPASLSRLAPLPDYLASIPPTWRVARLRHAFNFNKGLTITKEDLQEEGIPCVSYGEVHSKYGFEVDPDRHPLKCVDASYLKGNQASLLKRGDFIFADTSEDIEGSGNFTCYSSDRRAFAGYHTLIAKPKVPMNSRFMAYVFDSAAFRIQVQVEVKGVKVFSIGQGILKPTFVWLPPRPQQDAVAAFLDEKCAKVDEAVRIKEEQIALLRERRQILIQEAVTRGLNPDAPMKDSGIDWIGRIPAHWKLSRLRHLTTKIGSGLTPTGGALVYTDDGVPLLRSQNILFGAIDLDAAVRISPDVHARMSNSQVRRGDVLLNITGGSIGRCHYVTTDEPLNVNQHVCIIRPNSHVSTIYLNLLLGAQLGQRQIWWHQQGGGREGLNFASIKEFLFPIPPLNEQQKIERSINQQSVKIDRALATKRSQIAALKEYKTTLINAAVTGKIKVA